MGFQKNEGPCSVQSCDIASNRFRQFTQLAYEKSQKKRTYAFYDYLVIGQQLCHNHYMHIVEPDRHKKAEISFSVEIDNDRPTNNNTTQDIVTEKSLAENDEMAEEIRLDRIHQTHANFLSEIKLVNI
ncbi:18461_t:CDS:2, partial [Gigaspora rosea]